MSKNDHFQNMVKIARARNFEYRATSKLDLTIEQVAFYALDAWQVEVYHRDLKQFTGLERAIRSAMRAYLAHPTITLCSTA